MNYEDTSFGGMRVKKSTAIVSLIFAFLAGSALTLCIMYSAAAADIPAIRKAKEIYNVLDHFFIGELDETLMSDAVGEAMVYATQDRWSYYIPAEEYSSYLEQMQNAYVGIGISVLQSEDGTLTVTEVEANGSAMKAGILPEDEIIAIDGTDCTQMTLAELRNLVRGEEGTFITLTVRRGDAELSLTMERLSIESQVVRAKLLDDVGYIIIENFDQTSADKTIAAIEALKAQGANALLFDVRNNPGGLKDELVRILDYLLPEGVLFRSEDFAGYQEIDNSDAACVDLPMAVLINQDSYSAAEFFAAALSEYGAAVTVGTQTCGKGYFQSALLLSDGSAINISIGKYYTPNGISLADAGGLTPDATVELPEEDVIPLATYQLAPEKDVQLQKALELLGK